MLQNHTDKMRVDKVKPAGFFFCILLQDTNKFAITSSDSGCYRDLHLVNCGTHGHTHPKECGCKRKLESAGFVKDCTR